MNEGRGSLTFNGNPGNLFGAHSTPMKNHTYTVQFRVFGTAVEPDLITRELGLQPCQVRISGTSRFPGRVDSGIWAYNGGERDNIDWESLEEGLEFVLTKLWPQ